MKSGIRKKLIATASALALTAAVVTGGVIMKGMQRQEMNRDISRYLKRTEKYPEDPENYKILSKLYEKQKDYERAEKYYDLYKKIEENKEQEKSEEQQKALKSILNEAKKLSQPRAPHDSPAYDQDTESSDDFSEGGDQEDFSKTDSPNPRHEDPASKDQEHDSSMNDSTDTDAVNVPKDGKKKFQKALDYFKKGKTSFHKEDHRQAEEYFNKSIKIYDDYAPAYAWRGHNHLKKNPPDIIRARQDAKKALKVDHSDDSSHYVMGEVFRQTDLISSAEDEYQKTIQLNPKNYMAYYRLGVIRFKEKNYSKASTYFRKVISLNPSYHNAYVNDAVCDMAQGNILNAKKKLLKTISLNGLEKNKTALFNAYTRLAQCLHILKEYNKALKYINIANEIKETADNYWIAGTVYDENGQTEQARKAYQKALSLDKKHEKSHYNLGLIYFNNQQYHRALKSLALAAKINPKNTSAWVQSGKTFVKMGFQDKAYEAFVRALKIDSEHPTANIELAKYYKDQKNMQKAVQYAKIALSHAGSETEKLAFLNELGLIYMNFSLYGEAETVFQDARRLNPSHVETLKNTARLKTFQDRLEEAASLYQTVIKINPADFDTYEYLANIRIKQDRPQAAKEVFQKLLNVHPNHPEKSKIKAKIEAL